MRTETLHLRVFVSCPDDVKKEKEIVRKVCRSITKIQAPNVIVKVIDWKENVVPLITGESTQSVINSQIGEDYEIYVGIFWKLFGDKQSNGLTPTEEEFETALKRYKQVRQPLICLYFKTDKFYPKSAYEAAQSTEVQKFKERIKKENIGPYCEFKKSEFYQRIRDDLEQIIKNWASLTAVPVSKKMRTKVPNYLPRKVASAKNYGTVGFSFNIEKFSQDTLDVIEKNNRIALLGDAGIGKTTELKRIEWHFSKETSFKPFFVSLNRYVNENLSDLLAPSWSSSPKDHTIIILDGLDEIEAKNRNDAIRKIESFSEQYPSCKMIISCRKNFYKMENENELGTLSGFSSYFLLPLADKEVEHYIQNRLNEHAEIFKKAILANQLNALLRIPFYLVSIVSLFLANQHKLPENKAAIFEHLLNDRIKLDSRHFRTTIELDENRKKIHETLERLALGMEMLGRNYITNDEYEKLVLDKSLRTLIKYCTVWRKNEGTSTSWQFEHNNFQEYLAAKALSKKPLQVIKTVVSFKPKFKKIIPSWINTLSFLLNNSKDPELHNWILENEPGLVIKVEPSRIEDALRTSIFKKIFEAYKRKKIWIPIDKYNYLELARFGQSEDTTRFLMDEIDAATHYTTRCNAIKLLGCTDIQHSYRQRATQILTKYALERSSKRKRESEEVQAHALVALARLGLNSREIVNKIVPVLAPSDSSVVRFGLYYFIHKSKCLDEYFDVFLEGITYVRLTVSSTSSSAISNSRLVEESWNLKVGLEKAKSPKAIRKILNYFKNNPRALEGTSLSSSLSIIAENAAFAFSKDSNILELAIDLASVLANEYLKEEVNDFLLFFDKTSTRLQAFQKIFAQRKENDHAMNTLSNVANSECLKFFVEQYEKGKIADRDVWWFQNLLSLNNPDLFRPFNELINKKSGNKFLLPPKRDFDKERTARRVQDIKLLFNKTDFLNQIKLIFEKEQKQTFTSDEVLKVMTTHRFGGDQYFSDLAIYNLLHITKKKPASFEDVTKIVNEANWDWFCISELYKRFESDKEILTNEQKNWIIRWCYSNFNKVDFKNALIKKPDNQISTSNLAIYLWYFLRKLDLEYPNNVLLDMLSFDWIDGHQMAGIGYLEEKLNKADVTERILKNLSDGIQIDDVLVNHFDYCKRNKIKKCLPFALKELSNTNRSHDMRISALEAICKISQTTTDLEQILPKISDDFKWDVIEQLVKQNSEHVHTVLKGILESGPEQEKLKAAEFLIALKDLNGLEYYVGWVKRNKKISVSLLERSPIVSIQIPEAIPQLVELLKISYDNEYEDSFPSLHNIVLNTLSAIALQSDSNYIKVKKAIKHFIKDYSTKIEGVNFLNSYLEDLERSYYLRKSEKLDIDEVVKRLNVICGA
jgi:predicted NACHT family NTPase